MPDQFRKVHSVTVGVYTGIIYKDREWNEYRVCFSYVEDGKVIRCGNASDYHTGDYADAVATAKHNCAFMDARMKQAA